MADSTCVIPLQIVSAVELVDACPSGFPLDLIRLRVNGITASLSLFKLVMAENLLRRAIQALISMPAPSSEIRRSQVENRGR